MRFAKEWMELLEQVVSGVLGAKVVSFCTDISTRTGESNILFTLAGKPAYTPN